MAKRPHEDLTDFLAKYKRLKEFEEKVQPPLTAGEDDDSDHWPAEYLENYQSGSDAEDSDASLIEVIKPKKEPVIEAEEHFEIPQEILNLLSSDTEQKTFSKKILPALASKIENVLKNGIKKEERESLLKKYAYPENCKYIGGPKLNPEIAATLSPCQITGDKKINNRQDKIGAALAAIGKTIDNLIRKDDKENIEPLIDALNILSDAQHWDTKVRKGAILPMIDKKLLNFIDDTVDKELDDYLFGKNLGTKIKQFKTVGRFGASIKARVNQTQKPNFTSNSDRFKQGPYSSNQRSGYTRAQSGSYSRPIPSTSRSQPKNYRNQKGLQKNQGPQMNPPLN